jgi:hypothetical protein
VQQGHRVYKAQQDLKVLLAQRAHKVLPGLRAPQGHRELREIQHQMTNNYQFHRAVIHYFYKMEVM